MLGTVCGGTVACCIALAFTDLMPSVSLFQLIFNKIGQLSSQRPFQCPMGTLQVGTVGGLTTPHKKWYRSTQWSGSRIR